MSRVVSTQNLALYDTCPIGAIIAFPAAAIPGGWLECNGQAVSRTAFSELFALIGTAYGAGDGATTFNLPDYRGVFLRGKDNGKGYDVGRGLGDFQDQDVQPHQHPLRYVPLSATASTIHFAMTNATAQQNIDSDGTQLSTGAETRPKNVSVVYCIKATMAITTGLSTVSTYAALTHTTHQGEAVSFGTNGYKKFADGLIVQWGSLNNVANGTSFTFPLVFPNAIYGVSVTGNNGAFYTYVGVTNLTLSGFSYYSGATYAAAYWHAIGR